MDTDIFPIFIGKENVSDDIYIIGEICFKNGDHVNKGDVIALIENSKSIFEIPAPVSGYIFYNYNVEVGNEITAGSILAAISNKQNIPVNYFDKFINQESGKSVEKKTITQANNKDIRVSKAAQKLIEEHNIDVSIFENKTIIREEDVNIYIESEAKNYLDKKIGLDADEQNQIVIRCGGGHAKMCIDILRQMKTYKIIGIVDSVIKIGTNILDVPVIGTDNKLFLKELFEKGVRYAVVSYGGADNLNIRQKMFDELKSIGFLLPNLIHPAAIVELQRAQ